MKIDGFSQSQISKILKGIRLHLPHARIYAFGSRVAGKARKYSDLDLALDNGDPISLSLVIKIKEALSETDIPMVIDIIDYRSISQDFKTVVDQQKIELKKD